MVRTKTPLPASSLPLRLEYIAPEDIKANAKNWRIHPRRQRQAYNAFKEEVGWAGAGLLNETTGNLLEGHMRVDEAIKRKETKIPILIGSWTEAQENLILQNLDPLGSLASTNKEALASLTEANRKKLTDLSNENTRKLAQLTQDLKSLADTDDGGPLIKQSTPIRKPTPSSQEDVEEEAVDSTYEPPEDSRDD